MRRVVAIVAAAAYLAITSTVTLLHSDDCPYAGGGRGPGHGSPLNEPCPACKFLAGSGATQAHYDAPPILVDCRVPPGFMPTTVVVPDRHWSTSIILRAPPASSIS